jgi:hypothetical protein
MTKKEWMDVDPDMEDVNDAEKNVDLEVDDDEADEDAQPIDGAS